jgi:hypothetical protein
MEVQDEEGYAATTRIPISLHQEARIEEVGSGRFVGYNPVRHGTFDPMAVLCQQQGVLRSGR